MATHSNVLSWRISWMEKPGRLQSMGSHRVGHDWSDLAAAAESRRPRSLTWTWYQLDKRQARVALVFPHHSYCRYTMIRKIKNEIKFQFWKRKCPSWILLTQVILACNVWHTAGAHSLIRSSSPENFQFLLIFTSLQLERGKDFGAVSLSTLITEVIDFKPKGLHPEFLTKLRMLPLMTILT